MPANSRHRKKGQAMTDTDKTVAEIMALHHVAAKKHAEWCMCGGPDEKRKAHESLQADVALEQAIRRAVDWEQVAWIDEFGNAFPMAAWAKSEVKAKWRPLYARRQDQ